MKTTEIDQVKTENSTLLFVKEVAKYFMDFLETDFHKRRLPRRSIKLHSDKGLLMGINLSKYPSFSKLITRLVSQNFDTSLLKKIEKGVFKADIPASLLALIKSQIENIDSKVVASIVKELAETADQVVVKYKKDYTQAVSVFIEEANKVFKKFVVLKLVKSIEESLINSKLGDENTLFQMEEELSLILTDRIKDKSADIIKQLLNKEKVNVPKLLKEVIDHHNIKDTVTRFFEMFKVADLFTELHELYRNYKTEDKQEFYLYLYDISYEKNKYPLFYVPFSLERKNDELFIEFDSQLYINKKALTYIAQEYNVATNKKGVLSGIEERIIYLADHTEDLELFLQEQLTSVVNFFTLDNSIDLTKKNTQSSKSLLVTVSSNIYISLFDKSDEALINDYEEILSAGESSSLMDVFHTLIDDFIHKNPESIVMEVLDEWDDKDIGEKLVFQSPIPLNSEQLNIISALNRDKCKYLLVEGPPGTGKSHTITAIAFNAILQNKSVLILSDKKEALDVVEKNIVKTMNKVRLDNKFQNPILRLGKTGSNYGQILAQSSIESITEQFRAVRQNFEKINAGIDSSVQSLKGDITDQIESYNKITIGSLKEYAELDKHFETNEPIVDLEELTQFENSIDDLWTLRQSCSRFLGLDKINKIKFSLNQDIEEGDQKNISEIIEIISSLKRFKVDNEAVLEKENLKLFYDLAIKFRPDHELLQEYLDKFREVFLLIKGNKKFLKLLNIKDLNTDDIEELTSFVNSIFNLEDTISKIKNFAGTTIDSLSLIDEITVDNISKLKVYIKSVADLKNGIFGFLGKKDKLIQINKQFIKDFPRTRLVDPHKYVGNFAEILEIFDYCSELGDSSSDEIIKNSDFINVVSQILKDEESFYSTNDIETLRKQLDYIETLNLPEQEWYIEGGIKYFQQIYCIAGLDEFYDLWDRLLVLYEEEVEILGSLIGDQNKADFYNSLINLDLDKLEDDVNSYLNILELILESSDDLDAVNAFIIKYPISSQKLKIEPTTLFSLSNNEITQISDLEFDKLIRFISLSIELSKDFENIYPLQYGERMRGIEDVVTTRMSYLMDERFINFTQKYTADARALKSVIKSKKQFPREQFSKIKEAFPCILAGIRDYAEYIPLEPDLFDLVIIDEASQVSIAQSFPALLRAKKVIVLGDNQQFSNVKSSLAKSEVNQGYLNSLKDVFEQNISRETDQLARLEKFNIKVSILDFFEFINNYKTRLVKHFRGYKENISYSDKYFYNGSLQVMKIRGKPIQDVLKFSILPHDGKMELKPNTNSVEAEFILEELKKLREAKSTSSVGIITPHTNQQMFLYEKISQETGSDYFFDVLDLKIMTFDTCQGEERDAIYYSMVATQDNDKLAYIFIKDLNEINLDEDAEGKIKSQRLNVGFSRSKESMHFVLSKPIEKFSGSIGQALRHYSEALNDSLKEAGVESVDKNSHMEPLVLTWLYQTKFWDENKNRAQIMPQFELGKYLKQLEKSYNHPDYRVDFLLIYKDEDAQEYKIIIEYDGFLEHFGNATNINASNYTDYYSEGDVYRQQVLESYGYKFIRLNKFNLGKNQIETIDNLLYETLQKKNFSDGILGEVHSTIKGLQDQSLKECPRCGTVRPLSDFVDRSLRSGYGRFCLHCKRLTKFSWTYKNQGSDNQEFEVVGLQKASDINKFSSFVNQPEKYATGTEKTKAKIQYLDSIMSRMDMEQKSQYQKAKIQYEQALSQSGRLKEHQDNAKVLSLVQEAIQNHHIISMTYKGFNREVYPYSSDGVYCIAYCTLRNDLRTFRIDRMENVHISGIFNPQDYLQTEAGEKIVEAPKFRNQHSYYRRR